MFSGVYSPVPSFPTSKKRSLSTKRVVPWINRDEFICVYEEIYSDDPNLQAHAIERITGWRSRADDKLPVAIENTASLLGIVLNHQQALSTGDLHEKNQELQMAYAFAIMRFVNDITEKGQTQQYAQPLHFLSKQMGIPEWIVDLRNQVAHMQGSLPALDLLSTAVHWALMYFKSEFWEKQLEYMTTDEPWRGHVPTGNEKPVVDQLRDLIVDYHQETFRKLDDSKKKTSEIEIVAHMRKLIRHNKSRCMPLLRCVLEEGYLILSPEQLQALDIDPDALLKSHSLQLPNKVVLFWKPFLEMLHNQRLTSKLLSQAVSLVTAEVTLRNKLLAGWVFTVIKKHEKEDQRRVRRGKFARYKTYSNLPWKPLLELCARVPSYSTLKLLRQIQSKLTDTQGHLSVKVETLTALVELYIGNNISKRKGRESIDYPVIFTLQDLSSKCLEPNDEQNASLEQQNPGFPSVHWQRSDDVVDWSSYPIGCLPGQQLGYKSLELGMDLPCDDIRSMETSVSSDNESFHSDNLDSNDYPGGTNSCSMWTSDQLSTMKQTIHIL